ncbi:MAG: DUF2384 domain-containing protein [Rhodanobacter sp.]|nr:MAG: DUF2384 domain-containing protein [Rhodanobacter sp.]TAL97606.1 MAG: DUF2384 domain-containing protein [Rhodanobacter sp.]TAM39034.1 MAG: DUF2384 domain-containing protein [Rhodanobacter sp.]
MVINFRVKVRAVYARRLILRVLSAATEAFGDRDMALSWIRNEPVAAFRHKTALNLVS